MKSTQTLKADVLLSYGWNRVSYNILRSLTAKGLKVVVGDTFPLSMSRFSRYCFRFFQYPSFYKKPREFINTILSMAKNFSIQIYIPVHEEIFVVAKYIKKFEDKKIVVPTTSFENLIKVHKKDSLYKLLKELNIPTPFTVKPKRISDLKHIWNEIKGTKNKIVIKMVNTNSAKGVFYARSYDQLLKIYDQLLKTYSLSTEEYPLIQEYVEGEGYGVSMLFNKGESRAIFTHKRLREKISTGGTSTLRISTSNPLLEEYANFLLSSIGWHGVSMVEFKYNEKQKKAWLIEVNPRFWGSLALAIKAGVDFPFLLYKMAKDGDITPVFSYKKGVVVRWFLGDILATLSQIKCTKSFRPIVDFFSVKQDGFDDLYKDDIIPFLVEHLYYLTKFLKTLDFNPTEEALLDVDKL